MISIETYILSKKYTDKQVEAQKHALQPEVNTVGNLTGTTEPSAEQGREGQMYFQIETDGQNVKIRKTYVKTSGTWVELKMGGSGVISSILTTTVTVEKED